MTDALAEGQPGGPIRLARNRGRIFREMRVFRSDKAAGLKVSFGLNIVEEVCRCLQGGVPAGLPDGLAGRGRSGNALSVTAAGVGGEPSLSLFPRAGVRADKAERQRRTGKRRRATASRLKGNGKASEIVAARRRKARRRTLAVDLLKGSPKDRPSAVNGY